MKLMLIAGARPNFMKIAPLIRAIEKRNTLLPEKAEQIVYRIIHTGQHYDILMSEVFFNDLEIPRPHVNLEVGSGSHGMQTAQIMMRSEQVCLEEKPDWLIVVGDVNSTMACTLVAAKLGIPVAHVEAGLRSFDRTMPEEINRIVTDALATLYFTPSEDADENLLREGVPFSKIKKVGNVMIDSLMLNLEKARKRRIAEALGIEESTYALVTIHRPANTDDGIFLPQIIGILRNLSRKIPVVFPVHPRTRKQLALNGLDLEDNKNFKLIEPLGYLDFISLLASSRLVITDSGGLQEETTFLGIPCLTLRPNTERPVTVTVGTNKLTSLSSLAQDIESILKGSYKTGSIPELWDGLAADRIVEHLVQFQC